MESFEAPVVDGHVHFWDLCRFKYQWPTPNMKELYHNFLPKDYAEAAREVPQLKNAIFVQVLNKTVEENDWILELASKHQWIIGIVGGVDLSDPSVSDVLSRYAKHKHFLGVRHIIQLEPPGWLDRADVHNGLAVLGKLGLTYDLLLRPHELHHAADLAQKFPNLHFIMDHLGKPNIKEHEYDDWKQKITNAAAFPNVFCKLSGMVNQNDPSRSDVVEDFKPYVEHCVKSFGADRCFFGSDYPVFKDVNCSYSQIYSLMCKCLQDCTTHEEREGIFCRNVVRIYKIKLPLNEDNL